MSGWMARLAMADPPSPVTGASVDETRVQQTLYVDPANAEAADDDKHGTSEAPFATLRYGCQAAARLKDADRGTKLILAAGTYRESAEIPLPASGKSDTEAPLIIEAAERDQTVIDGADVEGWGPSTWKEEPGGRWSHPWPAIPVVAKSAPEARAAKERLPAPALLLAYRHGALLIVNGNALPEVNTAAELRPGTFCLQGAASVGPTRPGANSPSTAKNAVAQTVLMQPPEDTPLAEAILQIGAREAGVTIRGRRNVVVRGLCIQHAVAASSSTNGNGGVGLRIVDCANVLVEDVLSQWNDGIGLDLSGTVRNGSEQITLRRMRLLHNGGDGLAVNNVRDLLVEDSEASFNNFRGEWTQWVDPQRLAGIRVAQVEGSTWRRQRAVGNYARGLWFSGATNLTVEEAVVRENFASGVLFDACPGPTLLGRSLVARTGLHPSVRNTSADAGVAVYATPDLILDGNLVADNGVPAFSLADVSPGVPPPVRGTAIRGGTGPRAERHTLRHNVFYARQGAQNLVVMPAADRLGTVDFSNYFGTLRLQENCFWNPAATEVFLTYDLRGPRPPNLNFEAWLKFLSARAAAGGKAPAFDSLWQDPLFVDPAEGDFQLQENSPAQAWEVTGEDRAAAGQDQ